jgi:ribosomal protein S18 acetylase RimI-like enzyme
MMGYLEEIAKKINGIEKIMLTVFVRNEKGVKFYERLGFESKNFSPEPRVLRNGTVVESEYYIMHKDLER